MDDHAFVHGVQQAATLIGILVLGALAKLVKRVYRFGARQYVRWNGGGTSAD